MIRFRVIKGGTLLLGAALVVLAIVIAIVLVSTLGSSRKEPETVEVFSQTNALIPPPDMPENEHTDAAVVVEEPISTKVLASSNGMRVLIYHTHTHEAFRPLHEGEYVELEKWRTDDNAYNIVRVGEELAALLEERGFSVVHDTTDYEQDDLSTAYLRSVETLSAHSDEDFDLCIDLHRDAYTDGLQLTQEFAGANAAKLMMLVGRGDDFEIKPYYEENYALAIELTNEINAICPGLCRDVMVKTGRYNQHISPNSILIEAGNNMNTLDEALCAMPALADAIDAALTGNDDNGYMIVSYEAE